MSTKRIVQNVLPRLFVLALAAMLSLGTLAGSILAANLHQVDSATVAISTDDELGEYLVDAEGMSLYLLTRDEDVEGSACYDQCAQNWPPLVTDGEPVAGEGVDAGLLGTIEREDGAMQVTYNGWPLYYFNQDQEPGDILGHERGDVWFLLSPDGNRVEMAAVEPEEDDVVEDDAARVQQQMFQIAVATYLADTAGFQDLDERLNTEDGEIEPGDLGKVHGIHRILMVTDWPEELQQVADALITTLGELRQALSDQDVDTAAPLAAGAREAQESLSQAVDAWLLDDAVDDEVGTAVVMIGDDDEWGDFLVDGDGMTLYLFLRDSGVEGSACYDQCAERWPPLVTDGEPVAGEGVDAGLLGTIEREDGAMQVTYNGWPLYYWYEDQEPGDTTGQGVGDIWFVVSPEGEAIE